MLWIFSLSKSFSSGGCGCSGGGGDGDCKRMSVERSVPQTLHLNSLLHFQVNYCFRMILILFRKFSDLFSFCFVSLFDIFNYFSFFYEKLFHFLLLVVYDNSFLFFLKLKTPSSVLIWCRNREMDREYEREKMNATAKRIKNDLAQYINCYTQHFEVTSIADLHSQ